MKLEENMKNITQEELIKIREKLFLIQKEKVELLCKSIKFSTKLMSKIITAFENYETSGIHDNELLVKIKLFLKITRMVVENSKLAIDSCKSEKEKEFFTM